MSIIVPGIDDIDLSCLSPAVLEQMPRDARIELMALLEEREYRIKRRQFHRLFPDDGPLRRELYPKHMEFFEAGATHRQRAFMAANRVGKTVAGGYEMCCHLTGLYPDWWKGRRFHHAIDAWIAGKSNETTRDIIQKKLLGKIEKHPSHKGVTGFGIIPGHLIGALTWKQGVADLVDTFQVKHVTGQWSNCGLKSYEQGRGAFEGTEQHAILFDEEPPANVYGEALIRTITTNGIIMITFTPLEGMSEVVISFLPAHERPDLAA